jgi:glucose dehydrogenase
MRAWRWPLLGLVVGLGLTVVLSAAAGPRGVPGPVPAFSAAELTALPQENWISYNGNAFNQRHSNLSQINTSNVRQLRIAWRTRLVLPGTKLKPGAFGLLSEQTPVA